MALVFAVFLLGLMVTLVILKGVLQAHEYTKEELDKLEDAAQDQTGND